MYRQLNKEMIKKNLAVRNILADIVEALAGAIYLDLNFDLTKLWTIFKDVLMIDEIEVPKDFQSSDQIIGARAELHGLCGKRNWGNPLYSFFSRAVAKTFPGAKKLIEFAMKLIPVLRSRPELRYKFSSSSSAAANMDPSIIAAVEKILKYTFQDKRLLTEALTHSSFREDMSYERLEFIGDAALGLAVATHFFSLDPQLNPGHLTQLRKKV
ncbi:hypothetical protein J1N35_012507 [Gossypium stocksii]|uniref:RNase III domain-containing protein n=1 Tax=Gossypium stocksii TaxID=47602 RepID=A0A9D3W4A1_9ROSI|nr:hypothetical protein J1N35_012507 [Gossypium stocksii]